MGSIVIAGGGAAGLLAAIRAASLLREMENPSRVAVLEAYRETGRKILISGGGRCNVLPAEPRPERFISSSRTHILKRFLEQFRLPLQRAFFEDLLGGALSEEPLEGKLFPPSNRSRDVRDVLLARALALGVSIRTGTRIRAIEKALPLFRIRLDNEDVEANAVVVATGGLSVLPAGVDAAGFSWAAALGHTIQPLYPALAPMTAPGTPHAHLAGISLPATVFTRLEEGSMKEEGGFLFTHRGYSGPPVLNSSFLVEKARLEGKEARVSVCFSPEKDAGFWEKALVPGPGTAGAFLKRHFPDRLVPVLLAAAGTGDVSLSRLSREERKSLLAVLGAFTLPVTGTEGYRTAEITAGGVGLEEVDPISCGSRLVPGLFFAGEILDAAGPIGGFNFQWAWSTGWAAGGGAARYLAANP